jgi:homoserine O-acetyltransferase/O-succinyltransferase
LSERDYELFELGAVTLQSGVELSDMKLAYKTFGTLSAAKDNVILYPTRFAGSHIENMCMFGEGRALDPKRYFIIVPSMFGNSFSSSPSNTPAPYDGPRFPGCTLLDNALCQERFLRERFGIEDIALAIGWSMAAQNVYQWAALFPDRVHRLITLCGSARTSPHNFVFLEGAKRALTADGAWAGGDYAEPPATGLKAMSQVYAGWAFSQAFYRGALYERLGYDSLADFLKRYWEDSFLRRDANNMLAHIWTWQHGDISANETFQGDFDKALGAITAKSFVMPCDHDLYFRVADSEIEVARMANAELRVIRSPYGHMSAGNKDAKDSTFIDDQIRELMAS